MEETSLKDPLAYSFLKPADDLHLIFHAPKDQLIGEGKKTMRLIFDGPVPLTKFEEEEFAKFQKQAKEKGEDVKLLMDKRVWTNMNQLRFLQASGWNYNNAISNITKHNEWRAKSLPAVFDEEVRLFLQSGMLYLHGRDSRGRPIMVLNAYKIDVKKISEDTLIKGVTFFLEVVVANMLLPGQIENWVIILDFNNMGLFTFPVMSFKKMIGFLQSNYRARMYKLYAVNTPNSIWVPWKAVQVFLEENTVSKVSFSKQSTPENLFSHCNPSQVEKKFGGTAQDITEYKWPPVPVKGETLAVGEKPENVYITREAYKQKYEAGQLEGLIINDNLLH